MGLLRLFIKLLVSNFHISKDNFLYLNLSLPSFPCHLLDLLFHVTARSMGSNVVFSFCQFVSFLVAMVYHS